MHNRLEKKPQKFYNLINASSIKERIKDEDIEYLWNVYKYARDAHRGQKRKSGEPYFEHPFQTAKILAEMNMDIRTVAGGLLHDVIEDTGIVFKDIEKEFGYDVAKLVEGVTKISGITFKSRQQEQADNFRKMLLSVAEDIRVIIIKLADRLHNMQTLAALPKIKRRRIAIETRDVYTPLAHRLGMYKLKSDLEDLVLKNLDHDSFMFLQKKVREKRSKRQKYIKIFTEPIKKELKTLGISARVFGRPKHFYSIYRKMKLQNKPFEEIYDLLAIRIIVDSKDLCYAVLGVVHQLFTPLSDRFKDYIANHKANYYQSIHTTVYGARGRVVEIQIRTEEMEEIAEEGIAAHWKYKEGLSKPEEVDKYVAWLRDLVDVLQTDVSDPKDFMETLKIDLFSDEIFVFTPMGDLVRLAKGACSIDFAFEVHTQVGFKCIGAKVDGKIVPLNKELNSGQTIEIITSETQKPSLAWLKFVKTGKALAAIKKYFRQSRYDESVKLGKEMVEKENRKNKHRDISNLVQNSFKELGYENMNKIYSAIGSGVLTISTIYSKLLKNNAPDIISKDPDEIFIETARQSVKGVKVQGVDNLLVNFANCCKPIPGDEIIGFVSRGRGIIIHKNDCSNLPALLEENDRIIDVSWDVGHNQAFLAHVKVMGQEKKHFLKDVTEIISNMETNIVSIDGNVDETIIYVSLVLEVSNLRHLNKIITNLRKIQGIISIERK